MKRFKFAMKTHLGVQQREDIRQDVAERMKFVPHLQQGRTSAKWLTAEVIAVKGTMAVISTDATILQANISKPTRPLVIVDLEELPDSRERTGAPVLRLSCGSQIDVWELFSGNSYLSASLIVKDFWLQPQKTSEPTKLSVSHHSYCRASGRN